MRFLLKKFLVVLMLLCLLSFNVSALEFGISLSDDFYTLENDGAKVAEVLNMEKSELELFCEQNNIELLAVNSVNTKQIRLSSSETDFSLAIVNMSNLTNDKILSLASGITGLSNDFCEIVDLRGQKFIKVEAMSDDSGGKYILNEYITVADKQEITLSFYTASGENTDYCEEIFTQFFSDKFVSEENGNSAVLYVTIAAIVVFALISAFIIYTIIRDLKAQKRNNDEQDDL